MIYKYELWDSYPLEGDWKGKQINEVPANIVINDWVNGNILLSDYCLKMLVVELQAMWDNLQKIVDLSIVK